MIFLGPLFEFLKEVVKKAPLTPNELRVWRRWKAERDYERFRKKMAERHKRKQRDNGK